jgi:23S rRNA (pseudouridine1915-N3)-methyltransferase
MKIACWAIGKTNEKYLEEGIQLYEKRLRHYLSFSLEIMPDVKISGSVSALQLKEKEGALILSKLKPEDYLILLDERGKQLDSVSFAQYMEKRFTHSHKRIVFLIGGAYGFSAEVYARANDKLSLSSMTFSHQMIRLFFCEQLYRAMTILRNEPYHNT